MDKCTGCFYKIVLTHLHVIMKKIKKYLFLYAIVWYIQQVQKWKIKKLETRKYPRWDHQISVLRFLTRDVPFCIVPRGANVYVKPVVVRFILAAVSRALPQSVQASGISRDTSGMAPYSILAGTGNVNNSRVWK